MGNRRIAVVLAALAVMAPALALAEARMNFVGPKSAYAKAGLRTGDVVINVDGTVPKSGADVGTLVLGRMGDGKKHTILVRRNGANVTLEFGP